MKVKYTWVKDYYYVYGCDSSFVKDWKLLNKRRIRIVKLKKKVDRGDILHLLDEEWIKEKYNIIISGWYIEGYNNNNTNAFSPPFTPLKGNII